MPYSTWQDVQSKMQEIEIDNDSNPNISEVNTFITHISAEMDSRMQVAGITVPVTDADKILILNPIEVNGVKAEILRAVGQYENVEMIQKLYDEAMIRIEENPSIIQAEDTVTNGPGYYPYTETTEGERFQRGVKQW